ncbi:MAG: tetraacyldisaccharide 4'-kinase [Candidatus Omnitrophica bacterium]|jgi:tetraacyldisaccharide 4'-kinase|nr:tetraacyldisaccharide 4'-kinase [Candidatus Omnitrophota bacterium]
MREFLYNLATDKSQGFLAEAAKMGLFFLSLIYGLIVRVLAVFYGLKPYSAGCKVISVGNITLGGTGKTVLVEHIARFLKGQGRAIAILSRGYKRNLKTYDLKLTAFENMGDEPCMLQSKLTGIPIIVDADRMQGAKKAVRDYAVDTVILDDGFQQWKIKKDLDIVTIDATDPFGNQQVLPRGILREPLSSLKRAGIFVLTKTNLNPNIEDIVEFLQEINPQALIVESAHQPRCIFKLGNREEVFDLSLLKGKTIALFCGIGDPDSFENLSLGLGARIGLSKQFSDHHNYSRQDLENIIRQAEEEGIDTIVTTEKDAVRLNGQGFEGLKIQILVLHIELKITKNEEGLYTRLRQLYNF